MNSPTDSTTTIAHIKELANALKASRDKAQQSHRTGNQGAHTAELLSEATDSFLLKIWNDRLSACPAEIQQKLETNSAILAVGGSGRGELAPYSDTDLLILFDPVVEKELEPVFSDFIRDGWDSGLKIGSNFSPVNKTIELCRDDTETATSVAEARLLWGGEAFFARFQKRFYEKVVKARKKSFVNRCVEARLSEQEQLGSTVKHLQPNVKKSKGGLRDLHLLRWIAYAHYQTTDLNKLNLMGALHKDDFRNIKRAYEFLTRIRIDMHLHAGRAQDILTAHEQLRLAQAWGFEDTEVQRDVEQFMQEYFQHTSSLADIVDRFVSTHQVHSFVKGVASSITNIRVDKDFVLGTNYLIVPKRSRSLLKGQLEHILRLYRASANYKKLPSPQTTQFLYEASKSITALPTKKEAGIFMDYLGAPGFLDKSIRHMFRTEILDRVIPEFKHVRCLLQFNNYHSYTVDEHTFRAVKAVEKNLDQDTSASAAYHNISDKALLHLAVMAHDLGKGYLEDHSEVGRRMAADISDRLFLSEHRKETLMFLVHQHLTLADCAFRRDTYDPKVLYDMAQLIGTPEKLRMLYLLTIADLQAVGPGVWNDWKEELMTGLYDRLMMILSGKHSQHGEEQRRERLKTKALELFLQAEGGDRDTSALARRVQEQIDRLPSHYWQNTSVQHIVDDLLVINKIKKDEVHITGKYIPQTNTVEYRLITQADQGDGLFHRTVGALTARHQEILSAHIITTYEGYIIDTFRVEDPDYSEEVPENRIDEIIETIQKGIRNRKSLKSTFQKHMKFEAEEITAVSNEPFRIQVDNQSASHCSIFSIFAHDRRGLLYTIARCFDDLELSIMVAIVATNLDQVADVFYVVAKSGNKITDEEQLKEINAYLKSEIRHFTKEGYLQYRA